MSKIMFGMRSKIKKLVKLVKLNSNCSKSQSNSDIFFQIEHIMYCLVCDVLKTILLKV